MKMIRKPIKPRSIALHVLMPTSEGVFLLPHKDEMTTRTMKIIQK